MRITPENFDDLLLDYVYGELAGEDRAAFEAYVAEHPEARAALAEMQETRAAVEPLGADLEPSAVATQRVLARAREAAERLEEGKRSWVFRPWLATALAASVAVIIGVGVLRQAPPAPRTAVAGGDRSEFDVASSELAESSADDALLRREAEQYRTKAAGEAQRLDERARTYYGEEGAATKVPAETLSPELRKQALATSKAEALQGAAEPAPRFNRLQNQAFGVAGAMADAERNETDAFASGRRMVESRDAPAVLEEAPVAQAHEPQAPEPERKAAPAATTAPEAPDAGGAGTASDERMRGFQAAVSEATLARAIEKGRELQRAGNYGDAIANFQQVVAWAPADPLAAEAQFETARSLQETGRYEQAAELYQDVLDNAPAFPKRDELLVAQARCFAQLGLPALAVERYRQFQVEFPAQQARVQADLDRANARLAE